MLGSRLIKIYSSSSVSITTLVLETGPVFVKKVGTKFQNDLFNVILFYILLFGKTAFPKTKPFLQTMVSSINFA